MNFFLVLRIQLWIQIRTFEVPVEDGGICSKLQTRSGSRFPGLETSLLPGNSRDKCSVVSKGLQDHRISPKSTRQFPGTEKAASRASRSSVPSSFERETNEPRVGSSRFMIDVFRKTEVKSSYKKTPVRLPMHESTSVGRTKVFPDRSRSSLWNFENFFNAWIPVHFVNRVERV